MYFILPTTEILEFGGLMIFFLQCCMMLHTGRYIAASLTERKRLSFVVSPVKKVGGKGSSTILLRVYIYKIRDVGLHF